MKFLAILIPLIFTIGCADKHSNLQNKDTQYQRFLNYKADKTLDRELNSYDKK